MTGVPAAAPLAEPVARPHKTTVHIDFRRVLDIMGIGVRRASAFMALGLRTAADETVKDANLEEDFQFKFFPESLPAETIAEIRANFREWVIGNALKELDQHFSVFLDAVNEILSLTKNAGRPIEQDTLDGIAEFRDISSVAVKLDRLKKEHDVDSQLRDHLAGLSKARNALSHNLGMVRERQLTTADALELSWLGMDLIVRGEVHKAPLTEGIRVEKGEKVAVAFGARGKRVTLGAKVELVPTELSEICFTYWSQAVQIVKAAEAIVTARVGPPKAAAPPAA